MRISLKNNINLTQNYLINNKIIKTVANHKHLGILLIYDTKLCFNFRWDYIVSKAYQKFGFLKTICPRIDAQTFLHLNKTYILPILEYSNLCFTPNKTQIHKIEKVQKKITKFICDKMKFFLYVLWTKIKIPQT
jgi:hypothetical protein